MLTETLPIRTKLLELQRDGKIILYQFVYGLSHSEAYVKVEFEVNRTRERVQRTMKGKDIQEAADRTMELLGQVK